MSIETLNETCACESLDRPALAAQLKDDVLAHLVAERPHLFAALPVYLSREHVDAMAAVVAAVERVTALPAYQASLEWMPAIAHVESGTRGVFMGYDFHLGEDGPRLIEINTNAGGAMLNAVLARAQRACCDDLATLVPGALPADALEAAFMAMFLEEWRAAERSGRPARIAIVDDAPGDQFLFPEFMLFADLFRRHGIDAGVLDPTALSFEGGVLRDTRGPVDLVYNRLTDFSFDEPHHAALRAAWIANAAVITPHPRAHALFADKRNLGLLGDAARLRGWGVDETTVRALSNGIAHTRRVTPGDADELWATRRQLFFKPAGGFGSRAAYRGDKLTRRVWEEILAGDYVAQAYVQPGGRRIGIDTALKVDVRNYAYAGRVQLLAARLYRGQTTNLRTPGGGFAPVLTTPDDAAVQSPCMSASSCPSPAIARQASTANAS